MCRSTAAPLMAMAGMAGTAVGVAIAVLKEKADRRTIEREAREDAEAVKEAEAMLRGDGEAGNEAEPDEKKPHDG